MRFSDFILAILVLAGAICVLWIYDVNSYTDKLQVYLQQCDNMILDNSYCKGTWHEQPIETYVIHQQAKQVVKSTENQPEQMTYQDCVIKDRKNWTCKDADSQSEVSVQEGLLQWDGKNDLRQITRLEWLQYRVLELVD